MGLTVSGLLALASPSSWKSIVCVSSHVHVHHCQVGRWNLAMERESTLENGQMLHIRAFRPLEKLVVMYHYNTQSAT